MNAKKRSEQKQALENITYELASFDRRLPDCTYILIVVRIDGCYLRDIDLEGTGLRGSCGPGKGYRNLVRVIDKGEEYFASYEGKSIHEGKVSASCKEPLLPVILVGLLLTITNRCLRYHQA